MIVWVTSFGQDMYLASGRKLIDSFLTNQIPGQLYVFPEGVSHSQINVPGRVKCVSDPSKDPEFVVWFAQNKEVIPDHVGGSWKGPCKCNNPKARECRYHNMPCPAAWFNRNASRWVRKVVSLKIANPLIPPDVTVVWVDSDCWFKSKPSERAIDEIFRNGAEVVYLKSKRSEWETGVVGYKGKGRDLIPLTWERYTSGRFRLDARWDDCSQTHKALDSSKIKGLDVAQSVGPSSQVLPYSPWGRYLAHAKGEHRRKKVMQ